MASKGKKYVGQQLLIIFLVLIFAALIFALGLMVGYGVIGKGSSMWDILSVEKWQEIMSKFTGG